MTITPESLSAVAWPQGQFLRGASRNGGLAMDLQGRNIPTAATREASIRHRVCAAHLPDISR
jgi:hypothetical protein